MLNYSSDRDESSRKLSSFNQELDLIDSGYPTWNEERVNKSMKCFGSNKDRNIFS